MILTDTHSHLYDEAFDEDRDQAMQRAFDAGVSRIFLPAIDSGSHGRLFDLVRTYPENCFPMMGLHPTSVNGNRRYGEELALVEELLADPPPGIGKFYAIGEVGLDLHWSREWKKEQIEVFERQIELSVRHRLPLVIHTREAWDEMCYVLSNFARCGIFGIMHSYSGGRSEYEKIRRTGDFLFGVGGVVTYKNNNLAGLVTGLGIDNIVLETDCPYLTPVPFRGRRNEPAYLTYICDKVAEITSLITEEVALVTTRNSQKIFGI